MIRWHLGKLDITEGNIWFCSRMSHKFSMSQKKTLHDSLSKNPTNAVKSSHSLCWPLICWGLVDWCNTACRLQEIPYSSTPTRAGHFSSSGHFHLQYRSAPLVPSHAEINTFVSIYRLICGFENNLSKSHNTVCLLHCSDLPNLGQKCHCGHLLTMTIRLFQKGFAILVSNMNQTIVCLMSD